MISESQIIQTLQSAFAQTSNNITGIGDDAACIPKDKHSSWVITNDLFIEDVHFRRSYFDPKAIAHKSLHVNLSDIAAMGARPQFVLLGIALPRDLDPTWLNEFLKQFTIACQQAQVILIGGDTTESKAGIYISITLIGDAPNDQLKFRHGAKVGDLICVVGHLGEANLGFQALEQQLPDLDPVKQAFLLPHAKLEQGQWLGRQTPVTAMMDISDGLYVDLTRLCASAHTGAVIECEQLKPSAAVLAACQRLNKDPLESLLIGGEDYALLCTIKPAEFSQVSRLFEQQCSEPITVIGHMTADPELKLRLNGQPYTLKYQPFSHFGEQT